MIRPVVFAAVFALSLSLSVVDGRAHGEDKDEAKPVEPEVATQRRADTRVEEIVVTARKRDELLEDAPVSVTALSAATLREVGATRLDDIQTLVPNLTFATADDGVAADIRIRGIGTPQLVSIAFDPGVGVYVDGVYLPRTIGTLVDVIDMQQVEVLRGPQGTLFGKNTVGGAINITTAKPSPELEGFALVRPGNLWSVHTRGMLNIPVTVGPLKDRVFTRYSVAYSRRDGYVHNTNLDEYLSDQNSVSFLGSLRILPLDDVTIDVSGTWSKQETRGRGGQCVFVQETPLGLLDPSFYDACRDTRPFRNSADVKQLVDVESYGLWGNVAWDAGEMGVLDDAVFKLIGSWRQQLPRLRVDVDMTSSPALSRSNAGGSPEDGRRGSQQQTSVEGQFNASAWDERIHFVSGAFGFWEDATEATALSSGTLGFTTLNDREIDNWTWALYGQGTVDLTSWASLTVGLRYTQDKKGLFASNETPPGSDAPSTDNSEVFTAWTPMASLALFAPDAWIDATPIDHFMGYFTYSRGFRGGGFNGLILAEDPTKFDPETLDSFEIGFKTISFDQRVTLNLSAFLGKYDDIQVTAIRDLGDTNGDGAPDFDQTTLNAAKATTHGAEIELLALPYDGWRLDGSVGLLGTSYDDFPNAVSDLDASTIDRSGETFDNAPELQTHLGLQYAFALDVPGPNWVQGWLTPRLDWYYQSEVHLRGPEVDAGVQSGYNLLHTRLSYDFNDDRTQVALWGKNLTDEEYFDNVTPIVSSFGVASRLYAVPRTFGAEISHRF